MRIRAMPVKMIASAITIGSGGSGGSEGPTAQMAATTASFLARTLRMDDQDARVAVTAGMAAGVGAIFRAPLGGAALGVELLFRRDKEPAMAVPSLIASSVAYMEFGVAYGYAPMFGHVAGLRLGVWAGLLIFPVLGLCCGILARLYPLALYGISGLFDKLRVWRPFRVGLGGLATGTLGLVVPGVLGTGYGTIQYVMSPQRVLHLSLLILVAMPFAKMFATSMSIGSGGSGGVFGPGMVIGATAGALLWRLAPHDLVAASPALLVAVGMAACLGAAAHAPAAIILIAAETCGNPWLPSPWVLVAALLAVPVAVWAMGSDSLYRSQPMNRAQLAAQREQARPDLSPDEPPRVMRADLRAQHR
jgi:CIC family chloride channel protein